MSRPEARTGAESSGRLLAVCVAASLAIALSAAVVMMRGYGVDSLFGLANQAGPTAKSLLEGRGLTIEQSIGSLDDPLVFRAARMPMASVVVAALAATVGPGRILLASVLKSAFFLVPVWASMRLALRWAEPSSRVRAAILLLLPFAIPAFLADVVNLQVEEGYAYSLLAYAFALVLFPDPRAEAARPYRRAVLLGLSLAGLFLTKSSMILVAAGLGLAYLVQQRRWGPRLAATLLVLGAVVGWGVHQKAASGRFALGTSMDGINFHKGNNARFDERYPPPPGDDLDRYDAELSAGRRFGDEWAYDGYHKAEGLRYVREHPAETAKEDAKKAFQYYVSLAKLGSTDSRGALRLAETVGLLIFRVGFWVAIVLSLRAVVRDGAPGRLAAGTFLGLALLGALPYLLGFAYTRHASVLIAPTALLLCRAWCRPAAEPARTEP